MPASHFDVNSMTGLPKFIVRHSTFGLEILMLLTVGSIPRSTDDAFHQFQQMFPEPVVILVAFRQHCTRLVQRYLQTGDVKKAKPTSRTSTLPENVVENVRGRMEQSPRNSMRKLSLQKGVILI
jgi:hypothetical protein